MQRGDAVIIRGLNPQQAEGLLGGLVQTLHSMHMQVPLTAQEGACMVVMACYSQGIRTSASFDD